MILVMGGDSLVINLFSSTVGSGSNEQDLDADPIMIFVTMPGVTEANSVKLHGDGSTTMAFLTGCDGILSISV